MAIKRITEGPRIRQELGQNPTYLNYTVSTAKPTAGYPYSGVIGIGGWSGSHQTMLDVVTKDFHKKIRAGVVINNPMTKISLETGIPIIDCTTSTSGSTNNLTRRWFGEGTDYLFGPLVPDRNSVNFGAYPNPPGVSVEDCSRILSTVAWKNVNVPSALSLVTLAEAQKSFDLIFDRSRKLAAVIDAFRKGGKISGLKAILGQDIRKAPRPKFMPVWLPDKETVRTKHGKPRGIWVHEPLTKERWDLLTESQRVWLEWRYGWNPLVKDIVDHMKAITLPEPWRERKRHTARSYYEKDGKTSSTIAVNSAGGIHTRRVDSFAYVKGRGYVIWELNPGNPFGRLNDFGLFDIPRTILELIPYSFVAEWFIKTDDFLQAWQPKIGATIVASGSTIKVRKRIDRELIGWTLIVNGGVSWPNPPIPIGSKDWFVINSTTRTVPLPLPDRPIVEVNLNVKRLVDAFALTRQSVSRPSLRL